MQSTVDFQHNSASEIDVGIKVSWVNMVLEGVVWRMD